MAEQVELNKLTEKVPAPVNEEKENMGPVIMNTLYDPLTGISTPISEYIESDKDQDLIDIDALLNHFMEDDTVQEDDLKRVLKSSYKIDADTEISANDMIQLMKVVSANLNGEKISSYFDALPLDFKNTIFRKLSYHGTQVNDKKFRESVAKELVENLSKEYIQSDSTADLDNMISEISKYGEELNEELGKLQGVIHISVVTKAIDVLEKRKTEDENSGEAEKVQKWEDLINGMKETINLDKFKEFCKRVKIKHYDLERPDKVFMDFNRKYINHKLNIYNIQSCPGILSNHINDHITDHGNVKVCLAFCKYCLNMSPNNPTEHAFMYYFIKNIIASDLVVPKGVKPETMDQETVDFYDTFMFNLRECIENIR